MHGSNNVNLLTGLITSVWCVTVLVLLLEMYKVHIRLNPFASLNITLPFILLTFTHSLHLVLSNYTYS